jgi:L-amino acid N-acyltransferase YncA
MLIRHADPQLDGAACAAIYAPFVADSAVSFEETPPDGTEFARRIEVTSASYPWLVAEEAGEIAGYAYGSRHRERAAYRWTAEAAVYVHTAHRGRGVGKQLYLALLGLLARQGIRTVCAGVTLPNPASVGLHESVGFEPVGIYRRIGYKQGRWHDVGWWQLQLTTGEAAPDPPPEPAPTEPAPPEPGPPVRLEP